MKPVKTPPASANAPLTTLSLHGLNLKQYIAAGNKDVTAVARLLNVSRQTVYMLYGEQEFNQTYIKALDKAKVFIPGINAAGGVRATGSGPKSEAVLQVDQISLRESKVYAALIVVKDEMIEALEKDNARLRQQLNRKK